MEALVSITTGIDIVEVKRFREASFEENKKFYQNNFDENEIKYCNGFEDPYPCFAAKFALKEAFIKAARKPVHFNSVHTTHGRHGEPSISCTDINCNTIEASLSHEKDYAVAVVIIIW